MAQTNVIRPAIFAAALMASAGAAQAVTYTFGVGPSNISRVKVGGELNLTMRGYLEDYEPDLMSGSQEVITQDADGWGILGDPADGRIGGGKVMGLDFQGDVNLTSLTFLTFSTNRQEFDLYVDGQLEINGGTVSDGASGVHTINLTEIVGTSFAIVGRGTIATDEGFKLQALEANFPFISPVPVPVPSSAALLGGGLLAGLAAFGRRRRNAR